MTDKQIIAKLTAKLEAATKPKWVISDDEKPTFGSEVLVIDADGTKTVGYWSMGGFWVLDSEFMNVEITHWQPLPPAPEVK